jgi:hypothetical protein
METKQIKKMMIANILLFATISAYAQQPPVGQSEYTIIPIENIYLENHGNLLALNAITSKNIQNFLGNPQNIIIFEDKWSDEYDTGTIYEYERLRFRFLSFEGDEWLHGVENSSSVISVVVNGVRLVVETDYSVLNVFEQSWKTYQNLENTKEYQDRAERGNTEKTFIIKFPIKKASYEYLAQMQIEIRDGIIARLRLFLHDEA